MLVTPHNIPSFWKKSSKTEGFPLRSAITGFSSYDAELALKRIPLQFGDLSRRDEPTEPFFVDWLTIKQTFDFEIPVINAGVFFSVDANGELHKYKVHMTPLSNYVVMGTLFLFLAMLAVLVAQTIFLDTHLEIVCVVLTIFFLVLLCRPLQVVKSFTETSGITTAHIHKN
jgi:hypothetical protein